jgi:uncharacterized protein YeaC (DUF1315 family)
MNLQQILDAITPEVYERLKQAVELGRWPDGNRLTTSQRELCLQAVIAYDFAHKPETERVGYIHTEAHPHCGADDPAAVALEPAPIKWQH